MLYSATNSTNYNNSSITNMANVHGPGIKDGHNDECWLTSGLLLWIIINGILCIFILAGNILTIIAVRTCHNLRAVISNLFILSLAISDIIVGLGLPYHMSFYLCTNLGRIRALCLWRFFLIICACCVSILTLISIAIDRYIAIMYALHYRGFMTRRVACIIITINWLIGITVATVPIFWNNWSIANECEFDKLLSTYYIAGIITPSFIFIWLCMLLIYWRIMHVASKQAHQLRQSISHVNNHHSNASNLHPEWKSMQIVIFIMGCFTLCWLPYFIVAIAQLFEFCHSTSLIYKCAFTLAMSNSALNPIIYSWKNTNFRTSFTKILCYYRLIDNCYKHKNIIPEPENLANTKMSHHSNAVNQTHIQSNTLNTIIGKITNPTIALALFECEN